MTQKQQLSGSVTTEDQLRLKQLELNSLLEVTQAINANLPEESLYKIFHFTLISNLQIKKLALYAYDEGWSCKVNYGTQTDFKTTPITENIIEVKKIGEMPQDCFPFNEFDYILPIAHKNQPLAFVLAGGMDDKLPDFSFIQTFTSIIIVAVENKKLARKELKQEALRKELEIARDVQAMLFPKQLPQTTNIKINASYFPHFTIGGDYYDYVAVNEKEHLICIADVSGKGIPAAILMSNFQASLRALARHTLDLKQIVNELNYLTKANSKGERFITFFVGIYNSENKSLKYINAGHNPPVIIDEDGQAVFLEKGTTVIGVFDELPFIEEDQITINSKSILFLYTDGLTETSNIEGEEFGAERLREFLVSHLNSDLNDIHTQLVNDLNNFRGNKPFPDDITFVSCLIS